MKTVRIDPLARRELEDGVDYYEGQTQGLGDAFLLEVSRALRQLSEAPLSCPVVRGQIRRRPLFRFPYSVLYRVVGEEVQVLAIIHQRRGPKYVAARLRGSGRSR